MASHLVPGCDPKCLTALLAVPSIPVRLLDSISHVILDSILTSVRLLDSFVELSTSFGLAASRNALDFSSSPNFDLLPMYRVLLFLLRWRVCSLSALLRGVRSFEIRLLPYLAKLSA